MMYKSLTRGVIPNGVVITPVGQTYVVNEVENLFGAQTNGAKFDV